MAAIRLLSNVLVRARNMANKTKAEKFPWRQVNPLTLWGRGQGGAEGTGSEDELSGTTGPILLIWAVILTGVCLGAPSVHPLKLGHQPWPFEEEGLLVRIGMSFLGSGIAIRPLSHTHFHRCACSHATSATSSDWRKSILHWLQMLS